MTYYTFNIFFIIHDINFKQMDLQEIIKNRRTIKPIFFNGEEVKDSDIKEMLESANWAPTHKHTEPWRFIVYKGKSKLQFAADHARMYKEVKIGAEFLQNKYENLSKFAKNSSHIIAIIMKRDEQERIREIEEIAAVSCAVQNMMLVATEKNLANVWITGGLTYHPIMRDFLGFGEKDKVMGFLYVGKSDKETIPKRLTTIDDKIIWND